LISKPTSQWKDTGMTTWKGLILAGGTGSRLYPLTRTINKHLLPVNDKPMLYYPLTTLMFAGIRDFVLVTTSAAIPMFKEHLGDGSQWGLSIVYREQDNPGGIAEGLRIAKDDLAGCHVAMILGDNIFYGSGLGEILRHALRDTTGATVFSYEVAAPSAFGIVTMDAKGNAISIEEKPANPTSRWAVTGLYFYTPDVCEIAATLQPSARGELEITDVNRAYLAQKRLRVMPLGRGIAWLDGGTPEDLYEAGQFVKVIEDRTGLKIACPEEIALRLGLIDEVAFGRLVDGMPRSSYRKYLEQMSRLGQH
jgi:glucose-1-phosphate thymidylyltransferase